MSNRWAPGPRARWAIGAVAVVLLLVIVWALLVPGADWLARHDVGSAKGSLATARDAARGRLLTLCAGLLATGALLFTARNFTLSRRTFELTEQGQVTDRYTKAIEQLGSDKLDVRIGGIYALERVARDSAKDHPTVMEVVTAFIREHSREPWPPPDPGGQVRARSTRPDVQAAITVVGRRDAEHDIQIQPMDLGGADLGSAYLTNAVLRGANLTLANLTFANLDGAYLTNAILTRADLTHADLTRANLRGANLSLANFTGANLTAADLRGADLIGAILADAYLTGANLIGANLDGANLDGANLIRANLADAYLTRANFGSAYLHDARWPKDALVPGGWKLNTDSGRLEARGTGAGPTETN